MYSLALLIVVFLFISAYLNQNELCVAMGEVWRSEISEFYKNTGNSSVKQGFQLLQNCQPRDDGGVYYNTGEKTIHCKYLIVITVTLSSLHKSWVAFLEMNVYVIYQHFALSDLHSVTINFLFSGLPAPTVTCFLHFPAATSWTKVCLLSQGLSAIKAHNCHPKSIVSCCSLESCCCFAALPCDSLAFQLLIYLLVFISSAEVKYTNCSVNNGGCEHFCTDDPANQYRTCSCASGYQLMNDHTMCKPVGTRWMFIIQI